jgi:hypothetical protein
VEEVVAQWAAIAASFGDSSHNLHLGSVEGSIVGTYNAATYFFLLLIFIQ